MSLIDKINKKHKKYEIEAENLAVPEIHTGKAKLNEDEVNESDEPIVYEDLAIPEIHIKMKNK